MFRKVGRGRACPAGEGGAGSLGKARPQPGGGNHSKKGSPPGTSRGSPSDAGEPTPDFHPRTLVVCILHEDVGGGVWLRPWDWGVTRNSGARWLVCGPLRLGTSTQVAAVALAEFALIAALAVPLAPSAQHQHLELPRQPPPWPPPRPPPLPAPPPRRDGPDALHVLRGSGFPVDPLWAVEVSTYIVPVDVLPESHAPVAGAWCVALKPRGPPHEMRRGRLSAPQYPLCGRHAGCGC
jgi:hypothetical protein